MKKKELDLTIETRELARKSCKRNKYLNCWLDFFLLDIFFTCNLLKLVTVILGESQSASLALVRPIDTHSFQDLNQTQFPLPHRSSQSMKGKYGRYIWTLGPFI